MKLRLRTSVAVFLEKHPTSATARNVERFPHPRRLQYTFRAYQPPPPSPYPPTPTPGSHCIEKVAMVWMEPPALHSSASPVFNDLDLLVVAYDGTSEINFYPNNLATKDSKNMVEVVTISGVDSYEWFNVSEAFSRKRVGALIAER